MKPLLGAVIGCLGLAGAAYAQADAFNGVWKVDVSRSTPYAQQLPKQEFLTLQVTATGETAINDVTSASDGVRRRSTYTATYNDGKWYASKSLDNGQASGATVMVVRMDPHNELRIGKRADGTAGGFLLRTVLEDGKTMRITTYGVDGKVGEVIVLDKQPQVPKTENK
jgi:hypothetical protein